MRGLSATILFIATLVPYLSAELSTLSPHYLVGIHDDKVSLTDPEFYNQEPIHMYTPRLGHANCYMPLSTARPTKPEADSVHETLGIEGLRGLCVLYHKGYWTYEVCPFNSASQFHLEGRIRGPLFSLGGYEHTDDSNAQVFTGGTDGRFTKVSFSCATKNSVLKVEEPSPHFYSITLGSTYACEDSQQDPTHLVSIMLNSTMGGSCLFYTEGWWTYKFCYGESVSQFHAEQTVVTSDDGKKTIETSTPLSFDLGSWNASMTIVNATETSPAYASQWYVQGQECDLVNLKRGTEFRFFCNKDLSEAKLVDMEETSTCEYLATVETPHVCKHPAFKVATPDVLEIQCILQPEEVVDELGLLAIFSGVDTNEQELDTSAPDDEDEFTPPEDDVSAIDEL